MRLHGNARTCLHSRRLIVERVCEQRWTVAAAAGAAGVSERTAAKWLARYRSEGDAGLLDRSSAPRRVPYRTAPERVRTIELLRRLRMTAAEIAEVLRMPLSTVSAVLKRIGLGKRSRLEPFEPANRYECSRPGELVHIDVKKLGRCTRPGHRLLGRGPGRFEEGAGDVPQAEDRRVPDDALAIQQAPDRAGRGSLRDADVHGRAARMAVDLALQPEAGDDDEKYQEEGDATEERQRPAVAPGRRHVLVVELSEDGHRQRCRRSSQAWSITAAATLSTTRRRARPPRPSWERERSAVTVVRRSS